jgi:osmotically-inducible protein OsmY
MLNKRQFVPCLFAIGLLCLAVVSRAVRAQPLSEQERFDRDLMLAIEDSLIIDPAIAGHWIDVSVEKGIVKLQGAVHSWAARERAGRAAANFTGARDVVNLLEVRVVPRPDDELREDVAAALAEDPALQGGEIDLQVKDGVVVLRGPCESWGGRRMIYDTVSQVRGVRAVQDELTVPTVVGRTDAEIAEEVNRALAFNVWTDDLPVNVVVENARVLIGGVVPCCGVRTPLQEVVLIPGVQGVDAGSLLVDWQEWRRAARRPVRALRGEEVAQVVVEAFRNDPRTRPYGLAAELRDGQVILTGTVDHLRAKTAAADRAMVINQVAAVRNRIRVRPAAPVPADHVIRQAVERALRRDCDLDRIKDLDLTVSNGVVYLRGDVNSYFEAQRAQEVASGIQGVVAVENRFDVLIPEIPVWPDDAVRDYVQQALAWNPFVDRNAVTVMVEEGVMTLTGTVADRHARDLAMNAALWSGARVIHNEIDFSRPAEPRVRRVAD